MGGILRLQSGFGHIVGHQPMDPAHAQWGASLGVAVATGKHHGHAGRLPMVPLPEGDLHVGRKVDDPIDRAFTIRVVPQ
jgi:hypothetical protein